MSEDQIPAVEEIEEAVIDQSDDSSTDASHDATGGRSRVLNWCKRRWINLLLVAGLVLSAGAAGGAYWWMYRPDRLTDAAARNQVTEAAREGTVALLSYAPDTLDKDLANAKSHLTGEFLTYYGQFTDKFVAPASRQRGIKTEASVIRAAVSEMRPERAVVLAFVNQVTTSKERPDPSLATSSVLVTLVKSNGRWLISEFNPI